ncbi:MAG TPA: ATP-binding protein [Terriglobales bacterium]|jgi:signal transduction histidine kinase|nr:ATP-binding protein [Terriglobales bacterium]
MRRKTQLVVAVTFMVTVVVACSSYIYISQILRQEILNTRDTADHLASQIAFLANYAIPDLTSTKVDTNDPKAVSGAIAEYLSEDRDLNTLLESIEGNWPTINDAAIVDANDNAILHSDPKLIDKPVNQRPYFQLLQESRFQDQFRRLYHPFRIRYHLPTVYEVQLPLLLNGAPFGSVRVGISTVYLEGELTSRVGHALLLSGIAIFSSLILAAGLSNLALGPLEKISRSLDSVTEGNEEPIPDEEPGSDEYGLVTLKIAHLGRQMRDAKEIFSALKDNVDQIMANLQDGLMLFTRDSRVVLVSASVERFLGRPRRELLGRTASEIFTPGSGLSGLILDGFRLQRPIAQEELESPNGKRVQISLDFIQERGTPIGALLTLRDAESVRQIGDEIEMSRRMSASGRLTRGVAHEVKNPINAIVLHLQLLQNKLQQVDPDTRRHMDVIGNEIHRLDRVVQILVDFTRPRDLRIEEIDLKRVLEDVLMLATPDAEQHGVTIVRDLAPAPLGVNVDLDFMKQAILNVVLNGVQAMPQGGTLTISARREEDQVVTEIRDEGSGIPPEIQEKIFELYFTTKQGGSGIGLAQTYQVMQWHYGSVDFVSVEGHGTTFRLILPLNETHTDINGEAQVVAGDKLRPRAVS